MFKYTKAQAISLSISFLVVILLTLILFFSLRNKNEKTKKIPVKIITTLIVIVEIVKYFILFKLKRYDEIYPSFYCSFLWFWFLFADFTKNKFADSCEAISLSGSIAMTALLIVNPSSIVGNSVENLFASYLNFHHLLFHMLVVLHLFTVVSLKTFKFEKIYFLYVFIWVLILCLIIIPRAYILNANYMDLLYSPISIFETVRMHFGQVLYNVILISWFLMALEFISLVCYLYYIKFIKKSSISVTNIDKKTNTK